ncbi:uncharacterized protein SPPG_03113 [Spizellomyces punctatus DAOM BR117]|uniref:Thioredoxin domain-containing protein n=1 Tax=Spizellomyces punctatus (strain DAOM BR117) TaxID=645134 RepID=A0A0L0HKE6_SPIPD|nr:uncharacterized protein SPPG_03113 [Spizellomyces punctatus DAOM BR117]KND01304.1 hypothetical protein SPPG_03113 [Spizellomyces punctatus DAOM BR117]|eukprot:XP_016609343.1 hypothetical protein SPPG_03113 [Spizellomyces punctatus DAOM BR117]
MSQLIGQPLPTISGLLFVKGEPVQISASAPEGHKRVLVIEFWATWCGPCRQVFPHLSELQRKYRDKDVYFIGITDENDENKIRSFVNSQGSSMDYTVAIDAQHDARNKLFIPSGARGIPHVFLVDTNGRIAWAGHPADPEFESKLAALAQQATSRNMPKQRALPLVKESYEDLMGHSVKDLKNILQERGLRSDDCFEKADLARKIAEQCSRTTYYTTEA